MRYKNIQFIFKIIFFMMIVAIFYQAGGLYVMKKKVNIEIENTEKEVSEYSEKKKKLESNIKNFSEEEKIERVARDRLNLKKEGEVTYKIVD